jgi:hypothetical protein
MKTFLMGRSNNKFFIITAKSIVFKTGLIGDQVWLLSISSVRTSTNNFVSEGDTKI